jgi:poly-gamma-glutamate capsule biosynthesis protein CapA/YwtB (metallophosphatase superfamily)
MPCARSTLALAVAVAMALSAPAAAAPLTSAPSPIRDGKGRLVIHAVGDLNFDPSEIPDFAGGDFSQAWSALDGLFQRDDLTLANLECDPSGLGTVMSDKPFSFRCPVAALGSMRAAGIDVASMGNNHSGDYGAEGLLDGRANLAAAGLNPVGAGADLAQADQAAFFEVQGWTVAVLGFSAVSGIAYDWPYTPDDHANLRSRWFATDQRAGVAPATIANMAAAVAAVRPNADLVLVMLHQGVFNETLHPFADEVERAHALIDAGADIVFAHHHHRVLPLEEYHGHPIFYGLGSFVFPRYDPIRNLSAVAEVVVSPDGAITARSIPAYIQASGHPILLGTPDYQVRRDRLLIR